MRRFQFSGTEFSSLQHQVNQLLGLNCEFVLKYKDNEGDMITISSTEELACAIEISQKDNGGLFRLTVYLPETSATCPIPSVNVPIHPCYRGRGRGGKWGGYGPDSSEHPCKRFEKHWSHHGGPDSSEHPFKGSFEKRWSHHGGPDFSEHPCKGRFEKRWSHHGGPDSSEHPCKKRFEKRREKLTFKRDMFKAYLSTLEQIEELSPEEERRKQRFQAKVQRLDSILAQFFPPKDKADYPSEKPDFCPQKEIPEPEKPVCCPQKEISESEKPVCCPQKEIPESEKPDFYQPKRMCHRKFEKKSRKCEKKEHKEGKKKERKNSYLSEEAKAEITTLKSQIKEMKPSIWAIQEQLKTKKAALRVAFEAGRHDAIPELENEIWKLKQKKRAKKEQIKPLRQRVHQLKGGN
jgi:hypothetical protein